MYQKECRLEIACGLLSCCWFGFDGVGFGWFGGPRGFDEGFFGDVELFHVATEEEAGLGVEGGEGHVGHGGDGDECPLDDHEEIAELVVVAGHFGEHFDGEDDGDGEAGESDGLDDGEDVWEGLGFEADAGLLVDPEGDEAAEGDKDRGGGPVDVAVHGAPELGEGFEERGAAVFFGGEEAGGDEGGVADAVSPAAELLELGVESAEERMGEDGVLADGGVEGDDDIVAFEVEIAAPVLVAVFDDGADGPEIHGFEGGEWLGVGGEIADHVRADGVDDRPERVAEGEDAGGCGGVPDIISKEGDGLEGAVVAVVADDEFVGEMGEIVGLGAVVGVEGGDDDVFGFPALFSDVFGEMAAGVSEVAAFADDFVW